jgi:hypothetical protein
MRQRRLLAAILVLGAVTALPVSARADDPGLTVLTFLKLGAGAHAATLGDAYVAVAGDASATYWNPAGLLGIARNDVLGSHNAWIQDLRHEFVALGAHRGRHAAGISFIGLYTDDIESRDETGASAGHFGYSNNAFSASYAFQAVPALGVGATVRYLRESVVGTVEGDFAMTGFAFDVGTTWHTPFTGLTAAGVLRNVGGKMSYDFDGAQEFDLPLALQVGWAYRRADFQGGVLTVAGDLLKNRGDDTSLHIGAEYAYHGQFLFGAGYKSGLENENVSFGIGYLNKVRVNYAFTPIYDDLGSSHRISLGYAW